MAKFIDPLPEGFSPGNLDLTKPVDNLTAMLKLQGDLSGEPVLGAFEGQAWGWVPDEQNLKLFGTFGIGCSRVEFNAAENGYRFYHKEVLYYTDLETGKVLDTWVNPMTGYEVEVQHILNDPVHRFYPLSGGRFSPPYPYQVLGDRLVFQMDIFRAQPDNPINRKDYPLHSQQDIYQSAEMWAISGSLEEINDPEKTTAYCHTSWGRIAMWLPFMEMGSRPGFMVYHSQTYSCPNGKADLPDYFRDYTEQNYPQYLEAATEWDNGRQENSWTVTKAEIDKRRAEGRAVGQSVFGVQK